MSDKLNKFGFFAGKLFAKTVNEVKPLLANDAPPQPDLPTTLSPEEKIKKALDLLESNYVGINIQYLLNRYTKESNEIASNLKVGINDELLRELRLWTNEKINHQLNFYYKDNFLQILLTGSCPAENAGETSYELIILHNGLCVLTDRISEMYGEYANDYRHRGFSDYTLKSFKNGSWMDDLDYLNKNLDEHEKNIEKIKKEKQRKQLADKLDLDPLD
jgi:hypothetical protein